jgi:hypothetical protein
VPDSTLLPYVEARVLELHTDGPANCLLVMEKFLDRSPSTFGPVLCQQIMRRYQGIEDAGLPRLVNCSRSENANQQGAKITNPDTDEDDNGNEATEANLDTDEDDNGNEAAEANLSRKKEDETNSKRWINGNESTRPE